MDVSLLTRTLTLRAAWRVRDGWSPERLAAHQQRALHLLRRHAYARSPFYRRHHSGLRQAPLNELPPVTKADLMDSFDDAVTAPGLLLSDLEDHLRHLTHQGRDPGLPWRRHWWVAATAGTTGRRGVFVWDRGEWATVLASYARANDWAGVHVGLRDPLRVAVVSSLIPTHQSAVVGASLHSPLVPTLRLDATAPIEQTVAALNGFAPRLLVGYASALRPLAAQQSSGRLHIAPQAVMSASEHLSAPAAGEMAAAWRSEPYDVYAATETAGIASPCVLRRRHLYEDLVVCESVNVDGAPVPPGTTGAKLLVTVLFSRTLPLIRYELTDRVRLGGHECPCGRPFRVLESVEGRVEDVLHLPANHGVVAVHPNVLHEVLDELGATGWQVLQLPEGLRVLLTGSPPVDTGTVESRLRDRLRRAGATPGRIDVEHVHNLYRTALGKVPLVRALPYGAAGEPPP
ncbi:phenylacetate--CoA ligase family protein [Georgenia daeguensis]|uniref:Phenylacetate--CoA ligase family protein n=2 Tax=Georgenia daeguensis TaxID=908355 RepID=A0ABP6URC8_9MICO